MTSHSISSRIATTGRLLVRSGIEIGRILDSMREDGATVSASLPQHLIFLSKLLRVEQANATMLLACSDNKKANEAALATRSLVLRCHHRGAQFAFAGDKPRYATEAGEPAIRCGMPTTVLGMQQRAGRDGIQAPPAEATVRCDLRIGQFVFASRLIDVSLEGMCELVTDPTIPLSAGKRLEGARVRHAQADPYPVDLEVCHATRITLPDGRPASRVVCKLSAPREVVEELIRLFIIDL